MTRLIIAKNSTQYIRVELAKWRSCLSSFTIIDGLLLARSKYSQGLWRLKGLRKVEIFLIIVFWSAIRMNKWYGMDIQWAGDGADENKGAGWGWRRKWVSVLWWKIEDRKWETWRRANCINQKLGASFTRTPSAIKWFAMRWCSGRRTYLNCKSIKGTAPDLNYPFVRLSHSNRRSFILYLVSIILWQFALHPLKFC